LLDRWSLLDAQVSPVKAEMSQIPRETVLRAVLPTLSEAYLNAPRQIAPGAVSLGATAVGG
jgi:hypothetical protein